MVTTLDNEVVVVGWVEGRRGGVGVEVRKWWGLGYGTSL